MMASILKAIFVAAWAIFLLGWMCLAAWRYDAMKSPEHFQTLVIVMLLYCITSLKVSK